MYSKILIATDGSPLAKKAVEHGLKLASSLEATAVIVTVTENWTTLDMSGGSEAWQQETIAAYEAAAKRSAQAILDEAAEFAASLGVACEGHHVSDRHPAEGIIEKAELVECDLIVMASHGRRGVRKMLLGSETSEVISSSDKPVLVLR